MEPAERQGMVSITVGEQAMSAGANVWSTAFPQAKSEVGGLVCANVYDLCSREFLLAMMECAALCSSLNRQPCKGYFAPQVSRAPGSTVVPSPCLPADLAGNHELLNFAVICRGRSGCRCAGQYRGPICLLLCEHGPGDAIEPALDAGAASGSSGLEASCSSATRTGSNCISRAARVPRRPASCKRRHLNSWFGVNAVLHRHTSDRRTRFQRLFHDQPPLLDTPSPTRRGHRHRCFRHESIITAPIHLVHTAKNHALTIKPPSRCLRLTTAEQPGLGPPVNRAARLAHRGRRGVTAVDNFLRYTKGAIRDPVDLLIRDKISPQCSAGGLHRGRRP
jgi:hypothetical protein